MKVARISEWGAIPTIMKGVIRPPSSGKVQVKVLAVGITQQVFNRIAEGHPTTSSEKLPFDPTVDGVVQDETTGNIYYVPPRGCRFLAERINVPKTHLFQIPRTFDPIKVAALSGPWLLSWGMLLTCAKRKVLIIGATTCGGRAAAQVARWVGAAEIIGVSDDEAALATVRELTHRVDLSKPEQFTDIKGVNYVLDFIGGEAGSKVISQINNGRLLCELFYMPAWGPRAGEPFVMDATMIIAKRIRIVDPALTMWRLMTPENREKLRFGLHLLAMLRDMPYEVVAKPLSEIESVWDEEDFKTGKKMLVLVPSKKIEVEEKPARSRVGGLFAVGCAAPPVQPFTQVTGMSWIPPAIAANRL
jgi:NADPH:quinone reductase-like Zn-dependent oxidoreductase